jgi:hypothetical protein
MFFFQQKYELCDSDERIQRKAYIKPTTNKKLKLGKKRGFNIYLFNEATTKKKNKLQ